MSFQTVSSFEEDQPVAAWRQVSPGDLDAVFHAWQQAPNKSQFMAALDLPMAQALTERILRDSVDTRPKRVRRRSDIG